MEIFFVLKCFFVFHSFCFISSTEHYALVTGSHISSRGLFYIFFFPPHRDWSGAKHCIARYSVNLAKRFALPVYIQNTLSQPIRLAAFCFKPANERLHLLTQNRTLFEFPLSCITRRCQPPHPPPPTPPTTLVMLPTPFRGGRLCNILKIPASFPFVAHLLHVRLWQPANFCVGPLQSHENTLEKKKALQVSSKRSAVVVLQVGTYYAPLRALISSPWHASADWRCYFYCRPTAGVT